MSALSVDPDALDGIAARLTRAGEQVTALGPTECADTGSAVLSSALSEFDRGWLDVARATSFDLRELGALVGAAAATYRRTEQANARRFLVR